MIHRSTRSGTLHSGLILMIPMLLALAGCGRDMEIQQPQPLYGETPIEYPITLWDRGVEGQTLLRVRVNAEGAVDSVEVVESSGHEEMDRAAVKGARDMEFSPGRRNGRPIEVWAQVPVHFSRKPDPNQQS